MYVSPPFPLRSLLTILVCGVQAGIPSLVLVELFVQKIYFAFQVVQVFLITTLTSAASAAVLDIIQHPMSAPDLLAQNLPKASNFYLSYILVQCMAIGATGLLHIFELIRHYVFGRVVQNPRTRFGIWYNLRPPRWGGVFPIYTNMACIGESVSILVFLLLANRLSFLLHMHRSSDPAFCMRRHGLHKAHLPIQHPLRVRL